MVIEDIQEKWKDEAHAEAAYVAGARVYKVQEGAPGVRSYILDGSRMG